MRDKINAEIDRLRVELESHRLAVIQYKQAYHTTLGAIAANRAILKMMDENESWIFTETA
jgi:DNA-binding GntR family transcriptional regulator